MGEVKKAHRSKRSTTRRKHASHRWMIKVQFICRSATSPIQPVRAGCEMSSLNWLMAVGSKDFLNQGTSGRYQLATKCRNAPDLFLYLPNLLQCKNNHYALKTAQTFMVQSSWSKWWHLTGHLIINKPCNKIQPLSILVITKTCLHHQLL